MSEPVAWQRRFRAPWMDGWSAWTGCTEGEYLEFSKEPRVDGWVYETRCLYASRTPDPRVRELVDALRPFARIDIDARGELMPGEYLNWEDWAEDVLRARAAIAAEGLKEGE
jgi:hypothetical protein